MPTYDWTGTDIIPNGSGSAVRADLNDATLALFSQNSSATSPPETVAYMTWADTATGLLKIRNAANSAWVTVGTLASANLGLLSLAGGTMTGVMAVTAGTAALPGIAVSGDLDTGLVSPGADQLAITTGGTSRLAVSTTAVSSTLAVGHPLGAVGTPSITFTGDLNTGFWSPAADTLAASTAGTEQLRVSSTGNFSFNSGYGSAAVAYGCRAWVNFNGTGTVAIRASGNVSSITDNGVGDFTVNFTTAMADTNYSAVGVTNETVLGNRSGGWCIRNTDSSDMTTTSLRIDVGSQSSGGAGDTSVVTVAIFR
jgi:hypothetical protein